MIPFVGFAPDLPPETPGIFTDCANIIPMPKGFEAQGSALSLGLPALASEARGFAVVKKLDGSKRIFAATETRIYEASSGAWTDRSRVGNYALGADPEIRTQFAQFGDVTLAAVSTANKLQASTSGAFADIADAPSAKIVETCNNFAFVFNYNDTVHGSGLKPNGWACSKLGDYTNWTPSVANQCVYGSFIDSPGPVVGAKRLGSNVIAYKERAAYIGVYVGAPEVWQWTQLSGDIGAVNQDCIVSIGTAHFFISNEDFQVFDGSRIESMNTPLRNWFFTTLDPRYRSRIRGMYDRINAIAYWYFPSRTGGGAVDKGICYNVKTGRWGRCDKVVEAVIEYVDSGITWDTIGAIFPTWDSIPASLSWDSAYWTAEAPVLAVFDSNHQAVAFNAAPTVSSITLGHVGENTQFSCLTRIRPRFLITPDSATLEYSYSNTNADQLAVGTTATLTLNRFDLMWSARWHRCKLDFSGPMLISGIDYALTPDGEE